MADPSGDAVLAFDGALDNHGRLRAELAAAGIAFWTRTDTEVVLQALRAWGDDALARLVGQFAIALWRPRIGALTLARDRLGIRPLYVTEHGGAVRFASEVEALLAAAPERARARACGAAIARPIELRGVEELPPGHVRLYRDAGVVERRY